MDAEQKWDWIQSELQKWTDSGVSVLDAYALVYFDMNTEWADAP